VTNRKSSFGVYKNHEKKWTITHLKTGTHIKTGDLEFKTMIDILDFIEYLQIELAKRTGNNKRCPQVIISHEKVILVNGNPRKVESGLLEHCEFIQLTDILTSGINQAINATASQHVKIDLGALVAEWIGDTRKPTWMQQKRLHRRFSVSCFYGEGKYYDVPLTIISQNQLTMDLS
jgi:hypothetical protein